MSEEKKRKITLTMAEKLWIMDRDRSRISEIDFLSYKYLYSVPKNIPRIKKSAIVINNFKKIYKDFSNGNFLKNRFKNEIIL